MEQAKSALSRLQQLVKTIEPDECSSPVQSSSIKADYECSIQQQTKNPKTSLLSSILSPKSSTEKQQKTIPTTNSYADAKMAAQHREIERLVESRQRLHTIKDQIASLHQTMTTPPVQTKQNFEKIEPTNEIQLQKQTKTYGNIQSPYISNEQEGEEEGDDDDDSELYRFECESGDGEEIDDDTGKKKIS